MRRFRTVRTRLLLVVVCAVALALIVSTVAFNVLLDRSNDNDANSLLRQRALAEREQVVVRHGRIRLTGIVSDKVGDSRVWIFEGTRAIEGPRAHTSLTGVAESLAGGPARYVDAKASDERLYAVPVISNGRRYGTVVAGLSLAPYEQTERTALLATLLFAATLLVVSGAAAYWLLRSALRPVAQMTEQAELWSEKDLDRRFAHGEPIDELSRLAATLDRLLDRIAASLRHERRFSAELSHELRTPLAKVTAEAELALRRPRAGEEYRRALAVVHENAMQLARIVDTLFAAAQQEAGPRGVADASEVATAALKSCELLAGERNIELELAEAAPARVGVDVDLAERILHPVLDNACRYGRGRVRLTVGRDDGSVVFTVDDDGPGVTAEELESIFEPASRGSAGLSAGPSAGLGLALARRLARSVSGEVEAAAAPAGGRFVVRLPTA